MIEPIGVQLIVLPKPKAHEEVSGSNIVMVNVELEEGEIVEVSSYLKDIYKKGDTVIFPKKRGIPIPYKGSLHFFMNGNEYPQGDILAIVREDNTINTP